MWVLVPDVPVAFGISFAGNGFCWVSRLKAGVAADARDGVGEELCGSELQLAQYGGNIILFHYRKRPSPRSPVRGRASLRSNGCARSWGSRDFVCC